MQVESNGELRAMIVLLMWQANPVPTALAYEPAMETPREKREPALAASQARRKLLEQCCWSVIGVIGRIPHKRIILFRFRALFML